MESITRRLTDTATILANVPKLLDLADERELAMLAALVKGYVDCGGPWDWESEPGYLEGVAIAVLVKEGDEITKDDVWYAETSAADSAVDYLRHIDYLAQGGMREDQSLLRSAISFARFGEPLDPKSEMERKPCTMRRAFELATAQADAEAARKAKEHAKGPQAVTPARSRKGKKKAA